MPSLLSRLVPLYLTASGANRIYTTAVGAEKRIDERRRRRPSHTPPGILRRDVTVSVDHRHDMPVYTVTPRTGESDGALVYLHGGGWVNEIALQHWQLVAQVAAEARMTVVVPIYPLVPFGTAGQVVAATVELVLEARAEHGVVCLAGDSAGGQIALSAAVVLRDEQGIVLPRTVLIAPALDLSMSNPEMDVVQPSDPWLAKPGTRVFIEHWRGDLAIDDVRVSPLAAEVRGLGPLTIFSGTRDILNPDARLLVAKARSAGVEVDYHEVAGLVHVYPLTPTPEGRAARATIIATLRRAADRSA